MQESIAPIMVEVATPTADLATQTAGYAAADLGFFTATQEAAAQSVATAGELVKSSGEFAMTAGEAAIVAAEAAGAAVMATAVGIALPVIIGGIGLAGLAGAGYYAWNRKGWTLADMKASFKKAQAEATTPGTWPQWEGYTDEAIWNDPDLLDAATRPEPSADELID
jgi:hypothetical protein